MESLDEERTSHDRRAFLGRLGKTLAVGLGFGLLSSTSASGSSTACAIFCSPTSCTHCATGKYPYHCTTLCGYSFNDCLSHSSCSSFCFSQNAC
jgi:hypothetical protein